MYDLYPISYFQVQPHLLRADLRHPAADHGCLLPADGPQALGPEAHRRGHAQSGQVQEDKTEGKLLLSLTTF